MSQEKILNKINEKYAKLGESADTYLEGLYHAKPINYWDYVSVDTLLSLQKTRTSFKDEEIFIMYHQLTELVFKMILHEIKQLVFEKHTEAVWIDKINRTNRYTSLLINSFDIMKAGMNYDDYNAFRTTLTPASGFQSAQFRYIEIYCTPLKNLLSKNSSIQITEPAEVETYFEHIYWKDAGTNRETGAKTPTLKYFEEKYEESFIALAKKVKGKTLDEKVRSFENPSEELLDKLKEFDQMYNYKWPLVHIETAQHYLDKKGENKTATGGSKWKKYLHPDFQQRKFFPSLWQENKLTK